MESGWKRCGECGKVQVRSSDKGPAASERCAVCGASLVDQALSEFAGRLARFGLGDVRQPLLGGTPELPDAK